MARVLPLWLAIICFAIGLSACSKEQASENLAPEQMIGAEHPNHVGAPRHEVLNQPVVGGQHTEHYAEKPATIEHGITTDPYTGTTDKSNYAAQEPIAPKQTAMEKMEQKDKR
jgi:hypothetical protein